MRLLLFALLLILLKPAAAEAAVACEPRSDGIDFGATVGSEENVVGAVTIHCIGSGRTDYILTLSQGGSGTYNQRTMVNGANILLYNLYANPARTQIIGDGNGGSITVSGEIDMGNATVRTVVVSLYGKIPAQSFLRVGTYTDTIVASLIVGINITTTSFPVTALVQPNCTILHKSHSRTIERNCAICATDQRAVERRADANLWGAPNRVNGRVKCSIRPDPISMGATVGTDTRTGPGTGLAQAIDVYVGAAEMGFRHRWIPDHDRRYRYV
jgi:spore coat protein U-like protein